MVEVTNLNLKKADASFARRIAENALKFVGKRRPADISLVLVSEKKIREINKRYRRKNKTTDVLSFEGLNEIFVCPEAVRKQAKRLKIPFKNELKRVIIHGILHLAGYDHEISRKETEKMRNMENRILSRLK